MWGAKMSELTINLDQQTEEEEVKEKIKLQEEYQKRTHSPDFAPASGRCWSCGKQIYSKNGISKEYAATRLVTGCPFCHRSYCD